MGPTRFKDSAADVANLANLEVVWRSPCRLYEAAVSAANLAVYPRQPWLTQTIDNSLILRPQSSRLILPWNCQKFIYKCRRAAEGSEDHRFLYVINDYPSTNWVLPIQHVNNHPRQLWKSVDGFHIPISRPYPRIPFTRSIGMSFKLVQSRSIPSRNSGDTVSKFI